MTVSVDGVPRYVWPVSTGVARYDTPDGNFKPFRMEKDHFSKEWDDAPMPYSIFFTKQGHAIHGTNHTSIGRPASHGCVRLSVAHAATLWESRQGRGHEPHQGGARPVSCRRPARWSPNATRPASRCRWRPTRARTTMTPPARCRRPVYPRTYGNDGSYYRASAPRLLCANAQPRR